MSSPHKDQESYKLEGFATKSNFQVDLWEENVQPEQLMDLTVVSYLTLAHKL